MSSGRPSGRLPLSRVGSLPAPYAVLYHEWRPPLVTCVALSPVGSLPAPYAVLYREWRPPLVTAAALSPCRLPTCSLRRVARESGRTVGSTREHCAAVTQACRPELTVTCLPGGQRPSTRRQENKRRSTALRCASASCRHTSVK